MNNVVTLRKMRQFYNVFDEDSYVLYYLLGYKIKNNKTGFHVSAYSKVINILKINNIDLDNNKYNRFDIVLAKVSFFNCFLRKKGNEKVFNNNIVGGEI